MKTEEQRGVFLSWRTMGASRDPAFMGNWPTIGHTC